MPTQGDLQRWLGRLFEYGPGLTSISSCAAGAKRLIRTLYDRHRFVIRRARQFCWIETGDFGVPPIYAFLRRGDRSIRGYKYKSISPKDSDGNLKGASKTGNRIR